jgi:predicted amidophosphoribosyltransferase
VSIPRLCRHCQRPLEKDKACCAKLRKELDAAIEKRKAETAAAPKRLKAG